MKYDDLTLEALAQRYVLGVMSWRARRRFGRLVEEDSRTAEAVYAQEEKLLPLAWSLPPVQPSALVWPRIARQLAPHHQRRSISPAPWLAAAMSMAFVIAALGWYQSSIRPPARVVETVTDQVLLTPSVGIIENDAGDAIWVARIYESLNRADVQVRTTPQAQSGNDYQLWLLRDDGVPVSVGLLPQSGDRSLTLSDDAITALARSETLAVSLEPLGGSPQAVPTGPVLFTAALLAP